MSDWYLCLFDAVISLDYIKRSFMKLGFNSSADLTDPNVMDQVLKEVRVWCESLILFWCISTILMSVHCSWRQRWLWEESPMWRWAGLKLLRKKWSKTVSESRRTAVKSFSDVLNDEERLKLWDFHF